MKPDLYTLFKNDGEQHAPKAELLERVVSGIKLEQNKIIRQQKILWRTTFFIFSLVTIATGIHAFSGIASSNFTDYASLIFSDTSAATSIWKELSISIVESLPVFSIGLFLASIYLLVWSAKKYSIRSQTLAY